MGREGVLKDPIELDYEKQRVLLSSVAIKVQLLKGTCIYCFGVLGHADTKLCENQQLHSGHTTSEIAPQWGKTFNYFYLLLFFNCILVIYVEVCSLDVYHLDPALCLIFTVLVYC